MDKILTTFITITLVTLFTVGSITLDGVGEYQMEANWYCQHVYTETEHQRWCRNEEDGFGHLMDIRLSTTVREEWHLDR